jgi:hypothetical protein
MTFEYAEISGLNPRTRFGLGALLKHLCGEAINVGCTRPKDPVEDCRKCQACMNWDVLLERLKLDSLRLEDLNDILILVDQAPVSAAFFEMFLSQGKSEISFEELNAGIVTFEGFAVLLFGNVRFAYRSLQRMTKDSLVAEMRGLQRIAPEILKSDFTPRRPALPLPAKVEKQSTWLLGYIAKNKAERDIMMYGAMAILHGRENEGSFLKGKNETQKKLYEQLRSRLESSNEWRSIYGEFDLLKNQINHLQDDLEESRRRGGLNTSHYLALDYMDVYVATSMRERWEFEDVHITASDIFSQQVLEKLKLRYFDPTQSFLDNRIDKGLVEALMLKRARCTIYMAQETDTFGKDSELATTLAQGKPVIVFVPELDVAKHASLASSRPLAYLQRRLSQLLAEDKVPTKFVGEVLDFLKRTASFDPYFQVIGEEESAFIAENDLAPDKTKMCAILAQAEKPPASRAGSPQ